MDLIKENLSIFKENPHVSISLQLCKYENSGQLICRDIGRLMSNQKQTHCRRRCVTPFEEGERLNDSVLFLGLYDQILQRHKPENSKVNLIPSFSGSISGKPPVHKLLKQHKENYRKQSLLKLNLGSMEKNVFSKSD